MDDMEIRINMGAQANYAKAVKKYGQDFADVTVAFELQLIADNLDCFDDYAELEFMQEFLPEAKGGE